jgi:NADH-quinone oxidoreductase subunit G
MREVAEAPAILLIGNNPTDQHPLLAWQIRTNVRLHRARLHIVNSRAIKLQRQAASFTRIPEGAEAQFVRYLGGDDSAAGALTGVSPEALAKLRETLKSEQRLVIIFGSELRGNDIAALVRLGAAQGASFICLGDYANSHGAADMGLYPDLLPGYAALAQPQQTKDASAGDPGGGARFHREWGLPIPPQPGLSLQQMLEAARAGKLHAMYVVGSNPVARYAVDPFILQAPFLVVQDMFMTETALLADVILPVANAYEKTGTFTNTCGDLQYVKKAGDLVSVKSDFEIIVRIAEKMGCDIHKLVPFGHGTRADFGQTRGAQSGEADQHAVWLQAHGLEPKVSSFDPIAVLDEIQRLVSGYGISRLDLVAGNDQQTKLTDIQPAGIESHPEWIVPANDTLFTSGTLGRYSEVLNSVIEGRITPPVDSKAAAD